MHWHMQQEHCASTVLAKVQTVAQEVRTRSKIWAHVSFLGLDRLEGIPMQTHQGNLSYHEHTGPLEDVGGLLIVWYDKLWYPHRGGQYPISNLLIQLEDCCIGAT